MDRIDATRAMLPPRGVKARVTEQNETQNAIDMEDPERHHHGKKRDEETPESVDIYEDLAEVSIELLRGFLQTLLETKARVQEARHTPAPSYAMQAYKTAGGQSAPPPVAAAEDVEVAGFTRLDLAAEALDKSEVRAILDQLEILAQNGIAHVSIQRGESFLHSIRDAIARA